MRKVVIKERVSLTLSKEALELLQDKKNVSKIVDNILLNVTDEDLKEHGSSDTHNKKINRIFYISDEAKENATKLRNISNYVERKIKDLCDG